MLRWRGVEAVPSGWGHSVITIGVFDGVHRGHQATIKHAVERARELGIRSVLVTFDPHPSAVVRPDGHPAILTELERKAELVAALGVDGMCVVPFTPEFSRLSPEEFVRDVLVDHLHARLVVVGANFRFGHRAAGTVAVLEQLGQTYGFGVESPSLVGSGDVVFSSTYIRSCVAAGDVAAAAEALGRPHRVEGVVIRGDGRGRELGYPTANLQTHDHAAIPADGVYAAWLVRGGDQPALPAAVSIGTNPTFGGRTRRVEAYALDFSGDLYGERIGLDFVARLREMRRYDRIDLLVAQMADDVVQTRKLLGVG
ncbi:MAG TPA: bifunctional riboflavin kinase/FAD synthetase [Micromonospora sp.]